MRTTIDGAGRFVIPKSLRERLGITPGSTLELSEDGDALRVEPVAAGRVVEVDGVLLIEGGEGLIDDELVRNIRLGLQR